VNLHTDAPRFADRVGSIYFLAHAREVELIDFSQLLANSWAREVRALGRARAKGEAQLRLTTPGRFSLRQNLELDDWKCRERPAHFELEVQVWMSGPRDSTPSEYFNAIVGTTYVDTAWPDFGCRAAMQGELRAGAADAALRLERALNLLARGLLQGHTRYYFVPTYGLRYFWLAGGGGEPE
jgi:hypothetical protein